MSGERGGASSAARPLMWRKSSASTPSGNCVELAALPADQVGIRNSRDRRGPVLVLTCDELAVFLTAIRAGAFDDLADPA